MQTTNHFLAVSTFCIIIIILIGEIYNVTKYFQLNLAPKKCKYGFKKALKPYKEK